MGNTNKLDLRKWIVQNPNALLDKNKIQSIISDAFQNDSVKINLLLVAFSEDIVSSLRQSFPWDPQERSRFIKLLEVQRSIVKDSAIWAVDTWSSLFSDQVIDALNQYEKNIHTTKVPGHNTIEHSTFVDDPDQFDRELHIRNECDSFYINPSLNERSDRIYIPCGVGNTDNGFFIYGIRKSKKCRHPNANVYALVYNLLVRSSIITNEDVPGFIRDSQALYEIDFRSIFRIAVSILQMVKNNYAEGDSLNLAFSGDNENLHFAVNLINHYATFFGRLIRIGEVKLLVRNSRNGIPFCLDGNKGIYVCDNNELTTNARELWYGRKINYDFLSDSLSDLEYLLSVISPYNHFLEGQFEALTEMVSTKKHTVCIMPTGSGKSLIYYLISFLQPLPLIIIAPTDILIQDQIRNLRQFHHIDNLSHLQLTSGNNFDDFELHNSLNYLTPTTFQNRNLLVSSTYFNKGEVKEYLYSPKNGRLLHARKISNYPLVANIVLDEIHCISNWGHDFRPEYLMLSRYLNKYLDKITLLGFTATANYTVVEDVQKQLQVSEKSFLSPIAYEKNNVSYNFRCLDSTQDMLDDVNKLCEFLTTQHERTIIFTKNDDISRKVANAVGYEADIFTRDNPEAYHHFVDGKCSILVSSDELGIGINFPNINNIIHFGLPLSKSEYVQQVGRAGRANEQVASYVLYLNGDNGLIPKDILNRNTPIDMLPRLLQGLENDYADIYRRLTNSCPSKKVLVDQLFLMYKEFSAHGAPIFVKAYKNCELLKAKQNLYMLYLTGFIHDWYALGKSNDVDGVDIQIDICSIENTSFFKNPYLMEGRMKEHLSNYFAEMGNNRESIAKTNRAASQVEIIKIYADWYYDKFLYHHNEQFLDLYEFIKNNSINKDSEEITSIIKDYFSLPFIKLKSAEEKYGEMSIQQIGDKVVAGINSREITNIERVNTNRYSCNLDYFLFCANLRYRDVFETDRLQRIFRKVSNQEVKFIISHFRKLYKVCSISGKFSVLNYFELFSDRHQISYTHFVEELYTDGSKDIVYFGVLARKLNPLFSHAGGN